MLMRFGVGWTDERTRIVLLFQMLCFPIILGFRSVASDLEDWVLAWLSSRFFHKSHGGPREKTTAHLGCRLHGKTVDSAKASIGDSIE